MGFINYFEQNWISFIFDIIIGIVSGLLTGFFQKNSPAAIQPHSFHQQVFYIKETIYHKERSKNIKNGRRRKTSEDDLKVYLFISGIITLLFLRYKLQIYYFFLAAVIISTSAVLTYCIYLAKHKMLKGLYLYYSLTLIFILTFSYMMLGNLNSLDVNTNGFSTLIQEIGFDGLALIMTKVLGYLLWVLEILLIPIIVFHIWISQSQLLASNRLLQFIFLKTAFITTKYKTFIPYLIILCITSWSFSSGTFADMFLELFANLGSIFLG